MAKKKLNVRVEKELWDSIKQTGEGDTALLNRMIDLAASPQFSELLKINPDPKVALAILFERVSIPSSNKPTEPKPEPEPVPAPVQEQEPDEDSGFDDGSGW